MILSWLQSKIANHGRTAVLDKADVAMTSLDDMIDRLRKGTRHPVRSLVSDIIRNRDNIAYMTTVYEANAEMRSAVNQTANGG